MQHSILIALVAFVMGCILTARFARKVSAFTQGEVLLITQRIEAIKSTDLRAYNILIAEWKEFIANKKAKLEKVSSELTTIIKEVKTI